MSIRRNTSIALLGSGLGFGLSLALTPVLSRLYTPAAFGIFSTVLAAASALVGFSTLRLEVRAQSEPDSAVAAGMIRTGLGWTLVVATGASLLALGAVIFGSAPWLWTLAGLIVLGGSIQLLSAAWLTRTGGTASFRELAAGNFLQTGGTASVQAAAGLFAPTPSWLIAGFAIGRLGWSRTLGRVLREPSVPAVEVRRRFGRYAATASTSALVNSAAGQLVVLLPAVAFGAAGAGIVAMATRLLVSPLTLVAQASSAGAISAIGAVMRRGESARSVVDRTARGLLLIGALPCLAAAVLGPLVLPALLGPQWAGVGTAVMALAAGAWAQFCVAPLSQVLNMSGHSRRLLEWDVARLVLLAAALVVPSAAGASVTVALGWFSAAQVVLYGALFVLIRRAATTPRPGLAG